MPAIVKQLGDDVVGASVYFRFEVIHFEQSIWRRGVSLRKAGHSDPKTAAVRMRAGLIESANEFDQIDCILERVPRFIVSNSNRPIAAQGENVANRRLRVSKENRFDLPFVVTNARKVRNRVELCGALNALHKIVRQIAC